MKPRVKTALGIEIGDRQISAALVEKTGQGVRVVAAATDDLPDTEAQGRVPTPGKVLTRVLRKLGRRARTRGIRVAVATPARSVILRLLDLPKQMPANLGEFVEGELKQYVAMSGRRISSDFCGVASGSGPRKRLLAVAADAAEIGQTIDVCTAARVAAESVEPSVLACARALLLGDKSLRRGSAMLAMLTRSNLILCLFSNGVLDFIRLRDVPAGMACPGPLCAWLCEELNAVLRYSRGDTPDDGAACQARLVLCEAGFTKEHLANLPSLEPGLQTLAVLDRYDRVQPPCDADGGAVASSMIAVGAASRLLEMEGDELRIDLTPQEVIRARRSSRRGLIAANAAAVAFVAILLLVQLLARTTDAMNRRIEQDRIAGQLRTMPAVVAQDRFVDAEIQRMTRELAGLDVVRSRREMDWSSIVRSIGQATPEGVCLTHMACDDNRSLRLKGMALSHSHAKTFMQNLDAADPFTSVRLTRVQRMQAAAEIVEYEIDCGLKPLNQEYDRGQRS